MAALFFKKLMLKNHHMELLFLVVSVLLLQACFVKSLNLIAGVNKYTHDASCCIVDSATGKVLFSQAKERCTLRFDQMND